MRRSVVLALGLVACRGTEVVAPSLGTVQVAVAMTGIDVDRDGVVVTLDDSIAVAVPSNGSYQFSDVVTGNHHLRLGGATANVATSAGIGGEGPSVQEGARPFSKVRSYEVGLRAKTPGERLTIIPTISGS